VLFLSALVFSCDLQLRGQTFTAQKGDFHQSSWGAEDGLGAVFDIRQFHNGYLWLITSRGVLRFDGVKFETMEEVTHGIIRNDEVNAVLVGRGDYVWLTTRDVNDGYAALKEGSLNHVRRQALECCRHNARRLGRRRPGRRRQRADASPGRDRSRQHRPDGGEGHPEGFEAGYFLKATVLSMCGTT
jgi:hypothetical protein